AADPDLARVRTENEELHKLIEEMKQIFEQASAQEAGAGHAVEGLTARAQQLEEQLRQKDEQVALLTGQIQQREHQHAEGPPAKPRPPGEEELARMADELEQERCQLAQGRKALDDDRRQLRDDEEEMMRQMREMEVQMAKERAEMARQRTDLQRLHQEIRHE